MDSFEQDESSFGEVDVAETEKLAEHDPGEPWGNTDNTDQGVVWGCFHGGSFSLELELGKVNTISVHGYSQSRGWGCFHCGSFSLE